MKIHVSGLLSFYWGIGLIAEHSISGEQHGTKGSGASFSNGLQQACPVIIYFVILWIGGGVRRDRSERHTKLLVA